MHGTMTGGIAPQRFRWAVAGTGQISHLVIPDIQGSGEADVVAVWSRNKVKADTFAAQHDIKDALDNFQDLLSDPDIDVIYIATPISTHLDLTRQALKAGKHVLVEKPMATCADEVEELFALAQENAVFLMEAMWMKFNPTYREILELLPQRIGGAHSLRAGFGFPFPDDGSSKWDAGRGGGALLDQAIYPVTLAHSLFGVPDEVRARGRVRQDGLDMGEYFTLGYADGRFAQCSSSISGYEDPSASISGPRGWIHVNGPFWVTSAYSVHVSGPPETMFSDPARVVNPVVGNGYLAMIRAVTESLQCGVLQQPQHTGEDTVAVFRILDAIRTQILDEFSGATTPERC